MYPSSVSVYKDCFPTLRNLLLEKDDLEKSIHKKQNPNILPNLHNLHKHFHIFIVKKKTLIFCNWFQLGLKMYIFMTLEITLL